MIEFTVYGLPQPKGSARAFVIPGNGGRKPRAVVTSDNPKAKPWAADIKREAAAACGQKLFEREVPLRVMVSFAVTRPISAKPEKRPYPVVKPDVDKLARTVLDALVGIVMVDDAQVVQLHVTKRYALGPTHATISITEFKE